MKISKNLTRPQSPLTSATFEDDLKFWIFRNHAASKAFGIQRDWGNMIWKLIFSKVLSLSFRTHFLSILFDKKSKRTVSLNFLNFYKISFFLTKSAFSLRKRAGTISLKCVSKLDMWSGLFVFASWYIQAIFTSLERDKVCVHVLKAFKELFSPSERWSIKKISKMWQNMIIHNFRHFWLKISFSHRPRRHAHS